MNGIEKITQRIETDTQAEIDRILGDARAEAGDITGRYQAQAKEEAAELSAKNQKAAAEREERLVSTAQMEARKVGLAAKQEMVEKAYELALEKLCSTARVTEKDNIRTVKIGGIANANGKSYALCFHHSDKTDGDVWVVVRGVNQNGFSLAFAKDKETVVDAEFKCLPQDDDGTLIQYVEQMEAA